MPSQRTLHISFPDTEIDLYNQLMRESALTYSPVASVCRRHMKRGMKGLSFKEKYCSPTREIMFKNIRLSNLVYEMLIEVSKKQRPQIKPEALVERLIKDEYSNTK